MASTSDIGPSFRRISRTEESVHAGTIGLASWVYRPNDTRSNAFDSARLPLSRFTLLVHRPQWWLHQGRRPVRSNVVAVYQFSYNRLTGRISIDAHADEMSNTIVWDVAIPRSVQGGPAHALNPGQNRTGAKAAIALHQAVLGAARFGHPAAAVPDFPGFFFAFAAANPPRMERTAAMCAAVRLRHPALADAADEAIPDDLCAETFAAMLIHEGKTIYAPQWLFGREPGEDFAVHPRNGTPRPDSAAPAWTQCGGWVMIDGAWVPKAQEPMDVVADLTHLLGRESLAAWEILVERGHLPNVLHADWAESCTDAEWARFREETLTTLFSGTGPNDLIDEWRQRTGAVELDDEDVTCLAFEDVRRPFVFEGESRVGVVRLQGYPSPETMTWRGFGFDVDLFSVRPGWEKRVRPITPYDMDRLRRGLPLGTSSRGRRGKRGRQVIRRG